MKAITLLICDDHAIVREGLRLMVDASPDIEVVGETEDGRQAVTETERLRPNVVLMDLAMPRMNGVEATRQITKMTPSSRVLVFSSFSNDQHVQQAIQAGAHGYLMKEACGDDLLGAIREVHAGSTFFSPFIFKRLMARRQLHQSRPHVAAPSTSLSSRQAEILQLIAEGYVTKQIAGLLSISLKTVEKHRQALMNKLDLHNIASLTCYAVSSGVVEMNCMPHRRTPKELAHRNGAAPAAVETAARQTPS